MKSEIDNNTIVSDNDYDEEVPPPLAALEDPFETSTTVKCCCIKDTAECNNNQASPAQQQPTTMNPSIGLMFSSRISSFDEECPDDMKQCCFDLKIEEDDFIKTCESHNDIGMTPDDEWQELCPEKVHDDNCGVRLVLVKGRVICYLTVVCKGF